MDHEGALDLEAPEIGLQPCATGDEDNVSEIEATGDVGDNVAQIENKQAFLSWKDCTVTVSSGKRILNQLSGFAEPGHLLAIMGPSGSGKSSLLSTLAGRAPNNVSVTGEILLNSRRANLSYGSVAAFLEQEETLLGTLTVYETLYYSTKLRFPDSVDDKQARQIVVDAIGDVGLQEATHTRIGTWYERGISGGERRRVCIAQALLTSPYLMFLDEPTSGLDSAAAFHVVQTLKTLSREGGRTILCSIHQPSSEVFEVFDDLCLLSDGLQIYFGPLDQSTLFFERNGLPCPATRSRADHYMHCVNFDFEKVEQSLQHSLSQKEGISPRSQATLEKSASNTGGTKSAREIVTMLSDSYSSSEERQVVEHRLANAPQTEEGNELLKAEHASFIRQCVYLTIRSLVNMNRDLGYYWLRLCLFALISISVGTLFFNLDHSFENIEARMTSFFYFCVFLSLMAVGGFPSHIEVMKVYNTERINGYYSVGSFVVANTISPLPFLLIIAAACGLPAYPLIKYQSGADRVTYFVINLFSNIVVAEYLMIAFGAVLNNYLVGIIVGSATQAIFALSCGFFRLADSLPKPFWKYPLYYIDYYGMSFQGFIQNEFLGTIYEGYRGHGRISGHYITYTVYEVEDRNKWVNIGLQWCVALGFRTLFYLLIKSKEVTVPAFIDSSWTKLSAAAVPQQELVSGGEGRDEAAAAPSEAPPSA